MGERERIYQIFSTRILLSSLVFPFDFIDYEITTLGVFLLFFLHMKVFTVLKNS